MSEKPPYVHTPARRFELHRDSDASGVSGTGIVASGLCWEDGRAAVRWHTSLRSTTAYESMADVEAIHGHDGKTRIVWVDFEGDYVWRCVMCGGGMTRDWCSDCGAHGTSALVPLWYSDDAERQHHIRWDAGVYAALRLVEDAVTLDEARAAVAAMRERHRLDDLRRCEVLKSYRRRLSATDARPVEWARPAERQAAAAALDARVAKLESVARRAALLLHSLSDEVQDDDPDLADEIDALLAGVPRG